MKETLALFQGDPVQALVLNLQTQTPTTDQVRQAATTAGVPIVEVTKTIPEGVTDYTTWISGQIDALAAALDQALRDHSPGVVGRVDVTLDGFVLPVT